jgi:hypothetical protein
MVGRDEMFLVALLGQKTSAPDGELDPGPRRGAPRPGGERGASDRQETPGEFTDEVKEFMDVGLISLGALGLPLVSTWVSCTAT